MVRAGEVVAQVMLDAARSAAPIQAAVSG